jgi:hypothetical protein
LKGDDYGLGRFSPRTPGAPWKRVLYLPGNHEFDSQEYDHVYARLRAVCDGLGLEWLERETIVIGHVRFVGATLWADFDALAASEKSLALQLRQREKAFRAANYYLRKYSTLKNAQPVLAEGWREMSLSDQAWLRAALETPFNGTTVAVTHFAPSLRSADPRGRPASATRWTISCRSPTSGSMATCTAATTTWCAACARARNGRAGSSPIRWATSPRANRRTSARTS